MVKCIFMEEVGIIKSTEGVFAIVYIQRKTSCEGCSLKICKPEGQGMEIEAFNSVNAGVGQKVRVVMKPYSYIKSSGIVYGIPALALVIGAVLGKEIFSRYLSQFDPDIISALFGFSGFVLSFFLIRLWTHTIAKKAENKPIVEEILE
jgi:sigma-E factor negative regulatory protein RseC